MSLFRVAEDRASLDRANHTTEIHEVLELLPRLFLGESIVGGR